ncbi:MAG: hypothetical protein O3A46_15785, partial [Candidatus Poribacteria bacterium]|nr:hypothetical protein [Candidatus Poribacteria bacterium]
MNDASPGSFGAEIGVTRRSLAVGALFVAMLSLVTPYNNHYVVSPAYPSGNHLPLGPLFLLTATILMFNGVLRRLVPRWRLRRAELAVVWCMMGVTVAIPSKAFTEYLIPQLVAARYMATPENQWVELFHAHLSEWVVPTDPRAITGFYEGESAVPFAAWVKPLAMWGAYALALYAAMYCFSVLMRRQWVEREHLAFPLAQLPMELITPDHEQGVGAFFRNRTMWIGFALAATIHLLNGANTYLPTIPRLPTDFALDRFLTERPWSALRPFPLTFQPSVIGVTYLLTLQVSFSVWFFYLLYKSEVLVGTMLGFRMTSSPGEFGYTRHFASHLDMGAFAVLTAYLLWKARRHLSTVARRGDDDREP